MVANLTTKDFGEPNLCNDFGVFDCVATDPANIMKKWCNSLTDGVARARCNNGDNKGLSFNGEASQDFPNSNAYYVFQKDAFGDFEAFPDVGVPRQFPSGTISGWDMRAFYAAYSPQQNRMYFAIDCFGICGDADGNGNPATIYSGIAVGSQYVDVADLGQSETFVVFIGAYICDLCCLF